MLLLPCNVWQMLQAPILLTHASIKKKKGNKKEGAEVGRADCTRRCTAHGMRHLPCCDAAGMAAAAVVADRRASGTEDTCKNILHDIPCCCE